MSVDPNKRCKWHVIQIRHVGCIKRDTILVGLDISMPRCTISPEQVLKSMFIIQLEFVEKHKAPPIFLEMSLIGGGSTTAVDSSRNKGGADLR